MAKVSNSKAKVSAKAREELRTAIYRHNKVAHEYVPLADDDIRVTMPCSNAKSAKCNGGRVVVSRANKVYCESCYKRTNAARMAIVARADKVLANTVADIEAGKYSIADAVARYS